MKKADLPAAHEKKVIHVYEDEGIRTDVFAHVITTNHGPCLIENADFSWEKGRMTVIVEGRGKEDGIRWSREHKM